MGKGDISNGLATVHNYSQQDYDDIVAFAEKCRYLIVCKEICPTTDRPHLHFLFQLHKVCAPSTIHKRILQSKRVVDLKFPLIKDTMSPLHRKFCVDYCKKGSQSKEEWKEHGNLGLHFGDDADFQEFGTFCTAEGSQRTDLDELRKVMDEANTWQQVVLNTDVSHTLSRNFNWAREYWAHKPPKPLENFQPREWQEDLLVDLALEPDDRKIIWFYDPLGGTGKSTITRYLVQNMQATCLSGKSADIFHAYQNEKIIVFDLPRSTIEDFINYSAIEKLKDGMFFSGKYNSQLKVRDFNAHVIVFSNHKPDMSKWSSDRYDIRQLSEAPTFRDQFEL